MRILVVEDDPIAAKALDSCLEREGHEVVVKTSGVEAYQAVSESNDIDVVIAAMRMPGVDGLQLIQRMKEDPRLAGVPVVLTAVAKDTQTVLRGIRLGATDFVTKPIDPGVIVEKMSKIERNLPGTVLVVDDERIIVTLLIRLIERSGHHVVGVTSGDEALEQLESNKRISVVLTDVGMSPMSGMELLEEIKKKHSGTPVLIMSGQTSLISREKAIASGAVGFVTKPFNREEIVAAVAPWMKRSATAAGKA